MWENKSHYKSRLSSSWFWLGFVLGWVFFSSPAFPLSFDFEKSIHLRTGIELCFCFSKQDVQKLLKSCCWQIFIRVWSCRIRKQKVAWLENYNKYFLKGGKIVKSRIPMGTLLSNCMLSWGGRRITDQRWWVEEAGEQSNRDWTQVKRNGDRKCLERTGQRSLSKWHLGYALVIMEYRNSLNYCCLYKDIGLVG